MSFLKHLNLTNSFFIVFVLLLSCSNEQNKKRSIAEVNDSKLYEEELRFFLASKKYNKKDKDEFIRQWVETETLYQEAKESGILDSANYRLILMQSKKELAAALITKKILDNFNYQIKESDIIEYYNKYNEDFRLNSEGYVINLIKFNDLQSASEFRLNIISGNWSYEVTKYKKENKNCFSFGKKFLYPYQIQPAILLKYIKGMLPSEVSIIIGTDDNNYYIVQLIKKFEKYDIPEFEYIRPIIKERILNIKKKMYLKNYISELYNKYEVKINR